jgi:hypothetical protein
MIANRSRYTLEIYKWSASIQNKLRCDVYLLPTVGFKDISQVKGLCRVGTIISVDGNLVLVLRESCKVGLLTILIVPYSEPERRHSCAAMRESRYSDRLFKHLLIRL